MRAPRAPARPRWDTRPPAGVRDRAAAAARFSSRWPDRRVAGSLAPTRDRGRPSTRGYSGSCALGAPGRARPRRGGPHGFAQRLRAVEDDQQTAVGAQAAALQIGEEVLTHPRVLRRPLQQAERVFLAIRRDPERHDQTMLTDMDAVDQKPDQVEPLARGGLPR